LDLLELAPKVQIVLDFFRLNDGNVGGNCRLLHRGYDNLQAAATGTVRLRDNECDFVTRAQDSL
jgi:hypothetical protein